MFGLIFCLIPLIYANTQLSLNQFSLGETFPDASLDVFTFVKQDDTPIQIQLIRTSTLTVSTGTKIGVYLSPVGPPNSHNLSSSVFMKVKRKIMVDKNILSPKRWWIAVSNSDKYKYAIRYCNVSCPDVCPSNCNQHGACDISKKTCDCDGIEGVVVFEDQAACLPTVDNILGLPVLYFASVVIGGFLLVIVLPIVGYFVSKPGNLKKGDHNDGRHGLLDSLVR